MNSLNSRFKGFGIGKRKSTASIDSPPVSSTPPAQITHAYPAGAAPPQQLPPQIPPQVSPPTSQPGPPGPAPTAASIASSSQATHIMNHPGGGPRPPSYTGNFQQSAQAPLGRTSPLTQNPTRTPPTQMVGGPPPINTGAPVSGYPPPMHMQPGAQPAPGGPGGPTGYPPAAYPQPAPAPQQQPTNAMASYGRPAAEVEGNSRSKAQLIVGIDFVCSLIALHTCMTGGRKTSDCFRAQRFLASHLPLRRTTRPKKTSLQSGRARGHTQNKR